MSCAKVFTEKLGFEGKERGGTMKFFWKAVPGGKVISRNRGSWDTCG